ncbi:MAG: RNA polymerase sigma factor [Limisphaerales bacterium]
MVELHEDTDLIRASQQGDHDAFELLVQRYQKMIHSLCYRMTGSMDDAADLAQETFVAAYQNLTKFRGDSKFSSWLYQIGVNHTLNWKEKALRRSRLHEKWEQERLPEDHLRQEETPADCLVQQALMKLKPKQRAAIVLTVYDGLSHAQAAKALRCSETTVSWRIFVARRQLKRLLQPQLLKQK